MSRLMRANVSRLWKSRFFWISFIFMAVMGVYMQVMTYADAQYTGYECNADDTFFPYVLLAAFIASVFSGLFVGVDYTDGTIRNKIAVGHNRGSVYFSNLLVSILAQFIVIAVFIVTALIFGFLLLGGFTLSLEALLLTVAASLLLTIALTSLFTMVAMVCKNRTITEIVCIIGMFVILLSGTYIDSRLKEPEYYSNYVITSDEGDMTTEEELNPNYLKGMKRKVYEALYDIIPGGQMIQMIEVSSNHIELRMLYSTIIAVIASAFGYVIFYKKDLN